MRSPLQPIQPIIKFNVKGGRIWKMKGTLGGLDILQSAYKIGQVILTAPNIEESV